MSTPHQRSVSAAWADDHHDYGPQPDWLGAAANRGLAVRPKTGPAPVLHEASEAVGGLGSSLNRLIEATQAIAHDVRGSLEDIDDIIERSPITR